MTVASRNRPAGRRPSLLRERSPGDHAKVTNIELFFDLVFAFAITQLSHTLLARLTTVGALETGILFLAVWWVWIYTSFATNWLDPERSAVRLMIFALMGLGLLMSCALPHAFDAGGLLFAGCYVAMQIGRTLFLLWALGKAHPHLTRNFRRVTVWFSVSALLWIAGARAEHDDRLLLWSIAIAVEYGAVWIGFWVPGLGRSLTRHWTIEGEHLAERCSLFVMIALGESILVTGSTAASTKATLPSVAAFGVAFAGSVAMWWIYFNLGYGRAAQQIAHAADPGRIARLSYTYVQLLIVGGIIVSAVADELLLMHPSGHVDLHTLVPMIGGPTLFLLGNLWFKAIAWNRPPLSHLVGFALLAAIAVVSPSLEPLGVGAAVAGVLLVVAAWETLSLRRTPAPLPPETDRRSSLPAKIW